MDFIKLKLNKDFKYAYPFGVTAGPVLTVLKGNFKELAVHYKSSHIESVADGQEKPKHSFNYSYSVINPWKKAEVKDSKLELNPEAQEYISSLLYNFVKEMNA
jgi:hypothetical protein